MDLRDALDDVYLAAAGPELVAATAMARRRLRWVHASEQLDIAPLLRGGELILTEGVNFAGRSDVDLIAYLDSLHHAGVVGIAIETTATLPVIPQVLLDHADLIGMPVVHLEKRVPFVQICESVNSQLADSALRKLQTADRISRILSGTIESVGTVEAVLDALSRETRSSVVLRSMSGDLIGRAGGSAEHHDFTTFDTTVSYGGTSVANLTFVPERDSDIYLITAGMERAPEIIAIALLSGSPITAEDRLRTRFFSMLTASEHPASDLAGHLDGVAQRLGLPEHAAYLSLVANFGNAPPTGAVMTALDSVTRRSVCQLVGNEYVMVLWFDHWSDLEDERALLIRRLHHIGEVRLHAAVGPGSPSRHGLRRCLAAARDVLALNPDSVATVRDSRDFAMAGLLATLNDEKSTDSFVDDQIGALLRVDRERRGELFTTLLAFVTTGEAKPRRQRAWEYNARRCISDWTRSSPCWGPCRPDQREFLESPPRCSSNRPGDNAMVDQCRSSAVS